jgi:hypothetical protein
MMKNLKLLVQHSAYTLFFNLKKGNVALLGLSKEKVIWTSFSHLNVWYDAWENFLTTYGFASEITHERLIRWWPWGSSSTGINQEQLKTRPAYQVAQCVDQMLQGNPCPFT